MASFTIPRIRGASVGAVALVAGLLAGCGSDSPEEPSTSPSATVSTLEGTWRTTSISPRDAEETLRKHGLEKWIKNFRTDPPFRGTQFSSST